MSGKQGPGSRACSRAWCAVSGQLQAYVSSAVAHLPRHPLPAGCTHSAQPCFPRLSAGAQLRNRCPVLIRSAAELLLFPHAPPRSYLCDNKFHTEALNELLEADNK